MARPAGIWGPEYDHLVLLVEMPEDEPYLADVGFGESSGEALRWNNTVPQRQGLIITRRGEKTETALPDQSAFFENLERHFGVVLSPELRQSLESKVWPGEV